MATCNLNIHAPIERAFVQGTQGAPLVLTTATSGAPRYERTEITFYVGDHDLARDLAHAINDVIAKHMAKVDLGEAA